MDGPGLSVNPCSEHVSGGGPGMMSPAAGVGVGTAAQVREPPSWGPDDGEGTGVSPATVHL